MWKILKPAYGLVESCRLWQATVVPWMIGTYDLEVVPSVPQRSVQRGGEDPPLLVVAKVVDDFFLRAHYEICGFLNAISTRFGVGRFSQDTFLVLNRLHIKQHPSRDIELSMEEYMETISPSQV